MDTIARLQDIADARGLTMFQLTQVCGIPYSTIKKAADRNSHLTVDTIEKICNGLNMPMSAFFENAERYRT